MQRIKVKIQIPHGSHIAFGPGKAQLLAAIQSHGSISGAAKSMNMSYKRAWELVMVMNSSFKSPLVTTTVGGPNGGGAALTSLGVEVLQLYTELQTKSEQFVLSESNAFLATLST